jgi:hypothetical protein
MSDGVDTMDAKVRWQLRSENQTEISRGLILLIVGVANYEQHTPGMLCSDAKALRTQLFAA